MSCADICVCLSVVNPVEVAISPVDVYDLIASFIFFVSHRFFVLQVRLLILTVEFLTEHS